MSSLNQIISEDDLNSIGKVLVLLQPHNLKIATIKRLTRASKVRELKFSKAVDVDRFVYALVNSYLLAKEINFNKGFSVYAVEGAKASRTMLDMATSNVCATFVLDASNSKKLHNACRALVEIQTSKSLLSRAEVVHQELVEKLMKAKAKNKLDKETKKFESLVETYAAKEIQEQKKIIDACTVASW
jgi:hypothetical protein